MPTYKISLEVESLLSVSQLSALYSQVGQPGIETRNLEVERTSPLTIAELIEQQRHWIEEHGSNIAGYVVRYGSRMDEEYYGEGGEAIYAADIAELARLEEML